MVDALRVAPNEVVHAGQPVVSLDRTQLATRYAVTQKALDMAKEEYADTAQAAMSDEKSKAKLAILASKVDQQQAELAYDKDMLDRAAITAPSDGIAGLAWAAAMTNANRLSTSCWSRWMGSRPTRV